MDYNKMLLELILKYKLLHKTGDEYNKLYDELKEWLLDTGPVQTDKGELRLEIKDDSIYFAIDNDELQILPRI